jgi:hypothetical protein
MNDLLPYCFEERGEIDIYIDVFFRRRLLLRDGADAIDDDIGIRVSSHQRMPGLPSEAPW